MGKVDKVKFRTRSSNKRKGFCTKKKDDVDNVNIEDEDVNREGTDVNNPNTTPKQHQ